MVTYHVQSMNRLGTVDLASHPQRWGTQKLTSLKQFSGKICQNVEP